MIRAALLLCVAAIATSGAAADAGPTAEARRETVYDLLRLAPLGDDTDGIRLGEGSSVVAPVVGGFNTGWRIRADGALDAHGRDAELVVHLEADVSYRLEVEVTPRGRRAISLFVDGTYVDRRRLARGRQTVTFEIPADALQGGEHHLTFDLAGRRRVRGRLFRRRRWLRKPPREPRRATFHRIEVRPAARPAERRQALYVQIPAREPAFEGSATGSGTLAVWVEPEMGKRVEVAAQPVRGEAAVRADLRAFAGQVARVTLVSSAGATWKEARLTAAAAPASARRLPGGRINVVLWVVDTLRADKLRCYNPETRVRTPNFDAFARRGVLFWKAIAQSSHSKPASATLLTGHYPASHGGNTHKERLRRDVPLVSELFRRAGYTTAGFASNGFIGKPHGFVRGWDTFRNLLREGKPAKMPYLYPHVARWLRKNHRKPFLLYVHSVDPHVPYNPPRHYLSLYWRGRYRGRLIPRRSGHQLDDARAGKFRVGAVDRRYAEALYDGEVTLADHYFGRFLDLLDTLGLSERTLVVVTADHGEEFWEHGNPGHGHTLYNELIRVPWLMGPAPLTPAGRVVKSDVEMVDLLPTVLAAVGLPIPSAVQGRNLLPLLDDDPPVDDPAFSVHEGRIAAAQAGRWKYILYRGGAELLFDLYTDAGERRNLAAHRPIVRRYLRGLLAEWLHRQGSWRKHRDGPVGRPR